MQKSLMHSQDGQTCENAYSWENAPSVSGTSKLKKSAFFLVLCCLGDDASITTSNLVRVDDREGENHITK